MKTHKLECLDTTLLSFMNKHPFFHNDVTSYRDIRRDGKYFKLIFQTEIEGNVQEVVYELSLEKGDTDCQCVLVSPETLIDGVGLVRPEDMSVLAACRRESNFGTKAQHIGSNWTLISAKST